MRNSLSGFAAVVVGSYIIVGFLGLVQPIYLSPVGLAWPLLAGSYALQSTFSSILNPSFTLVYVISWIVVGLIIGPFSKVGWNTLRSAIWVGLILAIFALASFLLDPANASFWTDPSRNVGLFYHFTTSLIISLLALPSALLIAVVSRNLQRETEQPIPEKIETICECGAVFKSRPMMCSECGRQLNED